jgi:hypothetical protein
MARLTFSALRLNLLIPAALLLVGVGVVPPGGAVCSASALSGLNIDFMGRGGGTAGLAARTGDPDNLFWNASALAFGTGSTAFAGFMDYLVGVRGGTVGYMDGTSSGLGCGLWLSYLSSGSISRTDFDDPTGERGASFKYTDVVSGISLGRRLLPYLSAGASVKFAREGVDAFSTSGLFADLSLTFKAYSPDLETSSHPQIYTSFIVRNLEMVRWEEEVGSAPGGSEAAVALVFPTAATAIGLSFYFREGGRREVRCGLELEPSDQFEVRLGYRRRTGDLSDQANDLPWERGLMAGFGLGFGSVWVDYTFEDASPLDNIHRFAVRSRLGGAQAN